MISSWMLFTLFTALQDNTSVPSVGCDLTPMQQPYQSEKPLFSRHNGNDLRNRCSTAPAARAEFAQRWIKLAGKFGGGNRGF
jgi:hypothetical protein